MGTNIEQGSSGNLTPLLSGVTILPYSVMTNGKVSIASTGVAVQLGTTVVKTVTIRALVTNSAVIYIGTASVTSSNGFPLSPSETVSLDISGLTNIYINGTMGDVVGYITLS